jgi:hypothetical protein
MTLMTAMTMNCRGSLQGCGTLSGDERVWDEPGYREYKADKGRRRCEVRTLYSSPNTSPATLIDGARHPVWVLNSRHIERASIIRWQGIREVAPPTLLHARNPRAAEQRDMPSTSTRGLVRPRRRRRLRGSVGCKGRSSTEPVRSPLATFLLSTRPIAPIRPEMVATNR